MELKFRNKKIKEQCEIPRKAQQEYGPRMGNMLIQRVFELAAATSLLDIKHIPAARLHKLKGSRSGEYAVDLIHPFRLVLKPVLQEGVEIHDLESIDIIRIEEVIDYHGKQKR